MSLDSSNPNRADHYLPSDSGDNDLLPLPYLTPRTLLGAADPDRELIGHLYATQIASTLATKNPADTRTLVLGLGLARIDADRETFFDIMDLIISCL